MIYGMSSGSTSGRSGFYEKKKKGGLSRFFKHPPPSGRNTFQGKALPFFFLLCLYPSIIYYSVRRHTLSRATQGLNIKIHDDDIDDPSLYRRNSYITLTLCKKKNRPYARSGCFNHYQTTLKIEKGSAGTRSFTSTWFISSQKKRKSNQNAIKKQQGYKHDDPSLVYKRDETY